ncbi:MAG: sigma-70 family RNA polymerase sigma factor [Akkermansiaceae bacterium]|nr:sigma-70 family RNA polymerase sigma factor [Akkermansiaceae bacterium]
MTDEEIVEKLIKGDPATIKAFFFEMCRPMLVYIGQYFCQNKQTPEELIGEFYQLLAKDNWHKLRQFKFSCSLKSYVSIIASRYFQHKRDKELLPLDENIEIPVDKPAVHGESCFFMKDLDSILKRLQPFDRFLVQRILIEGEKPGDILDEAREQLQNDGAYTTSAKNDSEFAGYVYTRYNRVRKGLQKQMVALGYGR